MTPADYNDVIRSKVAGAWNIHNALLSTPLDFFIAISSAAGVVGNRGQGAYAAANTFLDAFSQYRQRLGLPAASLDLTAVEDVGYLAENSERQKEVLRNLGGTSIREAEILALLAAVVNGSMKESNNNHCLTGMNLGGDGADSRNLPYYASDAKFSHLRAAILDEAGPVGDGPAVPINVALTRVSSQEEALQLVTNELVKKLSAILMIAPEDIDAARPVTAYGLDSLNAIELRNWITKELRANLQVLELLTSGSLTNVASLILKKRTALEGS